MAKAYEKLSQRELIKTNLARRSRYLLSVAKDHLSQAGLKINGREKIYTLRQRAHRHSQKTHNISVNKGITIIALKNFKHDYTYKISVNWDKLSKI